MKTLPVTGKKVIEALRIVSSKIKGLIFDCDGTLAESMPIHSEAWSETFAAKRLKVNPQQCQVFEDGDVGSEAARKAGMIATDVRLLIRQ